MGDVRNRSALPRSPDFSRDGTEYWWRPIWLRVGFTFRISRTSSTMIFPRSPRISSIAWAAQAAPVGVEWLRLSSRANSARNYFNWSARSAFKLRGCWTTAAILPKRIVAEPAQQLIAQCNRQASAYRAAATVAYRLRYTGWTVCRGKCCKRRWKASAPFGGNVLQAIIPGPGCTLAGVRNLHLRRLEMFLIFSRLFEHAGADAAC